MRLLLHQFRKDFRQTWVLWVLWLFFVLVQFGLAAWTVNPGDRSSSGIYGQVIGMIPMIHAVLVFVLIPLLVFQETPVGTTATWLSRPMPPATVLGSKLISFAMLVLLPLLGQCVVLFSHHVVWSDVVRAGGEIALKELTWIALATGVAVLCPNFGTFMAAAAGLFVLQYFSGWIWNSLAILLPGKVWQAPAPTRPFLAQSRVVAGDLLCIAAGLGVAFLQYLTRRTRLAIFLGIAGLLLSAAAARFWPLDFVALVAHRPPSGTAPTVPFTARLHVSGGSGYTDTPDANGKMVSRSYNVQLTAAGLDPDVNLTLQGDGGEQTFTDGSKLALKSRPPATTPEIEEETPDRFGNGNGYSATSLSAAIGHLPILNQQINGRVTFSIPHLYTLDADTVSKRGADLGAAEFRLKGALSGYRITAEIPLVAGAFFAQQSKRTTLTQVLKTDDGVTLTLRERSVRLLLAPPNPLTPEPPPVYLLLNRKRNEALGTDGGYSRFGGEYMENGMDDTLPATIGLDNHPFEVSTPLSLTFHQPQINAQPLAVPIDEAWVAEAVLVRLEPEVQGDFKTNLLLPDFALDGHTLNDSNEGRPTGPDLQALQAIALPEHLSRPDVWRYITRVLCASDRRGNRSVDDPQTDMLAKVGAFHATDLLVAMTVFTNDEYPFEALKSLDLKGQEDAKKMILRLLPTHTNLIELVVDDDWQEEAKPSLLARLNNRRPGEEIEDRWLDALALFHEDPAVKKAILDLLPTQQDVIRIVVQNHWEADAKPILISVIARTKPGSRINDGWIKVLDSFHDDSRVKAMLLRVLPSNQNAIQTVVENHWEEDAKPIMLETLAKAKPGSKIDERWFRVLAALPDQTGVKEAVLRVLPFCHDAIEIVPQNHWEEEACPIILDTLNKASHEDSFDDRWFQALDPVADRPEVKETVLRVLPHFRNAIGMVLRHRWQAEAKPVILDVLNKAKEGGANIQEDWYTALGAAPDQTGVKPAILRVLPFIHNAAGFVVKNHWQDEAQPIVVASLAAAKPGQGYDNVYIGIAAGAPDAPGVKGAVLHVLPASEEAIDYVVQNHWEAEAKPILLQRVSTSVLGQRVNPKWICALASLHDPATNQAILAYTENYISRHHYWNIAEDLRAVPGGLVAEMIGRVWKTATIKDRNDDALAEVAAWGFSDALDRAAALLAEPQNTDEPKLQVQDQGRNYARNVLRNLTPSPDGLLDADLAAWWTANKATLGFDPELGRYLPHPKTLRADESWPGAINAMKALGARAENGDATAFDDLEAAIIRATDGIDPEHGGGKMRGIRITYSEAVFDVFRNDVEKTPGLLANLEAANRRPALRDEVVAVYGSAARAGNPDALEALFHYRDHGWNLLAVVANLSGAVRKGDAKAIAFDGSLPGDPNSNKDVLDRAVRDLLEPANAGDEAARAAYRAVREARFQAKATPQPE